MGEIECKTEGGCILPMNFMEQIKAQPFCNLFVEGSV